MSYSYLLPAINRELHIRARTIEWKCDSWRTVDSILWYKQQCDCFCISFTPKTSVHFQTRRWHAWDGRPIQISCYFLSASVWSAPVCWLNVSSVSRQTTTVLINNLWCDCCADSQPAVSRSSLFVASKARRWSDIPNAINEFYPTVYMRTNHYKNSFILYGLATFSVTCSPNIGVCACVFECCFYIRIFIPLIQPLAARCLINVLLLTVWQMANITVWSS